MWYDYTNHIYDARISQLLKARNKFCGLDTRNVKLLLNKLADNGDVIAEAYRYALEAEDNNIKAKTYFGKYRTECYDAKDYYIKVLAKLCKANNWTYGKQKSDAVNIPWLIYFDLPDCQQISFHTKSDISYMPNYTGSWDGQNDTTLPKIEAAITVHFMNELDERKMYLDSTKEKREILAKKQAEKRMAALKLKEEEQKRREEEWEQARIQRREQSYSSEKMERRYNEFVNDLIAHADECVRIRYCPNGKFISEDNTVERFNLFVWEEEKINFYKHPFKVNIKYFDAFVYAYKIINYETNERIVSKEIIDKLLEEKANKKKIGKLKAKEAE